MLTLDEQRSKEYESIGRVGDVILRFLLAVGRTFARRTLSRRREKDRLGGGIRQGHRQNMYLCSALELNIVIVVFCLAPASSQSTTCTDDTYIVSSIPSTQPQWVIESKNANVLGGGRSEEHQTLALRKGRKMKLTVNSWSTHSTVKVCLLIR